VTSVDATTVVKHDRTSTELKDFRSTKMINGDDRSFDVALGYGLNGHGSIPGRGKTLFTPTAPKPVVRLIQSLYGMGAVGAFLNVKAAEA
jgi:hypothetical protein